MPFTHQRNSNRNPVPGSGSSPFLSEPTRPFSVPGHEQEHGQENQPQQQAGEKQDKHNVLQKMESRFNADFSNVEIHPHSSKTAQFNARAYTRGEHIHFAPGEFNLNTAKGEKVIAHEFNHVLQQRRGIVKPTRQVNGAPLNDDPVLENQADSM